MKEDELYIALGKQIKTLRENAHLTQEKLAEKAGISLDYLGKIEVNINKPGLKTLIKISNALSVPIKAIFDFKLQDIITIMKIGFDNEKYLKIQSEHIKERISKFNGKLYLELGGKLFDDHHASRVLPGFQPDSKLRMFQKISDSIEIVIVISAADIEKNKKRADLGITYDEDVLRLRGEFQNRGFMVGSVVITHYNGQPAAIAFKQRLEREGIKTFCHYLIEGYPHDVDLIASDEGFGKNDYVETERPLVIVTAPGPGSGKMAVCLSQLYNENKRGVRAGYAKFETFPVWNQIGRAHV